MARGGEGQRKAAVVGKRKRQQGDRERLGSWCKRLVIKLLLVFETLGHMQLQSYPLLYLDEKLGCLCWKEFAWFRALRENNEEKRYSF